MVLSHNIYYGYADNGLKFEGFIDTNTNEATNFYLVLKRRDYYV